jgi:hypothetical protein
MYGNNKHISGCGLHHPHPIRRLGVSYPLLQSRGDTHPPCNQGLNIYLSFQSHPPPPLAIINIIQKNKHEQLGNTHFHYSRNVPAVDTPIACEAGSQWATTRRLTPQMTPTLVNHILTLND